MCYISDLCGIAMQGQSKIKLRYKKKQKKTLRKTNLKGVGS